MPPVDRDAPTSKVSTTEGGGATDPTLASADVALGLLAGVGVPEAEGAPVVSADEVAVDEEVPRSDAEADGATVFEVDEEAG